MKASWLNHELASANAGYRLQAAGYRLLQATGGPNNRTAYKSLADASSTLGRASRRSAEVIDALLDKNEPELEGKFTTFRVLDASDAEEWGELLAHVQQYMSSTCLHVNVYACISTCISTLIATHISTHMSIQCPCTCPSHVHAHVFENAHTQARKV